MGVPTRPSIDKGRSDQIRPYQYATAFGGRRRNRRAEACQAPQALLCHLMASVGVAQADKTGPSLFVRVKGEKIVLLMYTWCLCCGVVEWLGEWELTHARPSLPSDHPSTLA